MNLRGVSISLINSPERYPFATGSWLRCQSSYKATIASSSPGFAQYVEMVINIDPFLFSTRNFGCVPTILLEAYKHLLLCVCWRKYTFIGYSLHRRNLPIWSGV